MAYDIGERVSSKFFGTGTVTSGLFKEVDEDDPKHPVTYQRVRFDKTGIETAVAVGKLSPTEDGGDIDD